MSTVEPVKEKKKTRGARKNYQRDLLRVIDYCKIKIKVYGKMETGHDSAVASRIEELQDVLDCAEGK